MKTENLNNLFEEWINLDPIFKKGFIRDGIVNEDIYSKSNLKLLFVLKEANDPNGKGFDYREFLSGNEEKGYVAYRYSVRIYEWAKGIYEQFPSYRSISHTNSDQLEVLKKVSFMNVSKIGGAGNTDYKNFDSLVDLQKDFIRREIDIIAPNIVISCVGKKEYWEKVYKEIQWETLDSNFQVFFKNNCAYIHFPHPSSRSRPEMFYYSLKEIFSDVNIQGFLEKFKDNNG